MANTVKSKIIQALKDFKGLGDQDIEKALALHENGSMGLDRAFIEAGLLSEEDLLVLLVREMHIPSIDLSKFRIDPGLKDVISEKIARQYKVLPIAQLGSTLTVAIADPFNIFAIDDLKNVTGKEIDVVMDTGSGILKAINQFYGKPEDTVTKVSQDIDIKDFTIVGSEDENPDEIVPEESGQPPIIRMVNLLIKEALKQRASDIHVEPANENMRVRFRIDGVLRDVFNVPKESQSAVLVRIKIMGRLDITNNMTPQDGRFKLKISGREVDFRVSSLPTTYGEKIVMRILDKRNLSVGLDNLGFSAHAVKVLRESVSRPFGMILVTGPTGSGKSTTLYSIINQLNSVERNIITVEDPVEYMVDGLTQIQVNPEIGLTFASGLKAMLRQSPDIVMVGEIRDSETADIAIKASLTGQLVFSTLHTNDAVGALARLVDMGVEPFLVASSLIAVCAQRLCRKVCPHCKTAIEVPAKTLKDIHCSFKPGTVFYEGKGCNFCNHTGYSGRIGATEVLTLDDVIRDMLIRGKSSDDIRKYACEQTGMVLLWQDMARKVEEGQTTLAELLRVAGDERG